MAFQIRFLPASDQAEGRRESVDSLPGLQLAAAEGKGQTMSARRDMHEANISRRIILEAKIRRRKPPPVIRMFVSREDAEGHRTELRTTHGILIKPFAYGFRLERIKYLYREPYVAILCTNDIWYREDDCVSPERDAGSKIRE